MKSPRGTDSGFTLIEVLTALGISAILMMAVVSVAELGMRSSALANRQSSFVEMSRAIRVLLDNPSTCGNFLRDPADVTAPLSYALPSATPEVAVGAIYMGSSPLAAMNKKVPGGDLTVSKIAVVRDLAVPVDPFLDPVSGKPFNRIYATLLVRATVPSQIVPLGGKTDYEISFSFVADVDQTAGVVLNCEGSQTSGRFDVPLASLDIYYSPIGTFVPAHSCLVGDSLFYAANSIACNRWCGGCGPTPGSLCGATLPGRGFRTGVATMECSPGPPAMIQCVCTR